MAIDREKLIEKIKALDGLTMQERNDLIAYLREQKVYGLVWEDKPEAVEQRLRTELPVLKEVKSRAIISDNPDAPNHILIEGDNLEALTTLAYTHEGKIDVIYIDPPYNTGNKDFVYNDAYVDKEDGYRHSKWLSFMAKRLRIAKRLLSDRGVIFISIDDNEQAQLKMLCDEIFGIDNFISSIPWHSRQSLQNDTDFSINHEYIVCFARNRRTQNRRLKPSNADVWYDAPGFVFYPIKVDNDKYDNPDNDSRGPWKADPFDAPNVRHNLTYPIVNPSTGEQHLPPRGRHWRMSEDKYLSAIGDNRILFGKNGKGRPQLKVFLNEQEQYGSIAHSWFEADKYGTATHGSKLLQELFGGDKVFSSPKPIQLFYEILKLVSLPENPITILDFFAGSGTTLHATMQLNAEDGGNRQCILVTNNENGICENVTYERNKRVISGYTKPNGENVHGLTNNNLRYYRTAFVGRRRTPQNMRRLMLLASDMLCIKENIYTEHDEFCGMKTIENGFRYFANDEQQMLIIYDETAIYKIVELLLDMNVEKPIITYVFSPANDPWQSEFVDVAEKVKLTALPAAIYNAYKRVLPKPDFGEEKTEPSEKSERLGGMFDFDEEGDEA